MNDSLLNLVRLTPFINKDDYDWTAILQLAKEQSILGIALHRAQELPSDKWPPKTILMKWIMYAEAIRRQNERVNKTLTQLVAELERYGIKPIFVKGQVIALEYDEPLLRQSGDIDVFIDNSDRHNLGLWLQDKGFAYTSMSAEKHIEIEYEGVTVELHHHLNVFASKQVMRYWQTEFEDSAMEKSRVVEINGAEIRTLGITDTLVHLIVHAHHHLLTEGIGLRQLMDMALFINNHFDELDLSLLHRHIVGIGHEKAFNAYMALLNKYLGLPKEKIPFELDLTNYIYADKIMQEVWRGGNFGHKNNLKGVKPGLLHSLNTARLVLKHSIHFYHLAPTEARSYWLRKIFWRTKRKTK